MTAMQESSVLFSLKALQSIEEARVREEQEAKRRRIEAEWEARIEAERIAREKAEARAREEAAQQAREDAARREEAARIEAIRLATIERARVEAEQKARIEAMTRQQEHERKLAALKEDAHKRRLQRSVMFGGIAAVLLFGSSFGAYFGKIKPDMERRQAELIAQNQAVAAEIHRLHGQADDAERRFEEAKRNLQTTEAEMKRLADEVAGAKERLTEAQAKEPRGTIARLPSPNPESSKPCLPGDPLCANLP
jgi:colicin import membrane protein